MCRLLHESNCRDKTVTEKAIECNKQALMYFVDLEKALYINNNIEIRMNRQVTEQGDPTKLFQFDLTLNSERGKEQRDYNMDHNMLTTTICKVK